MAFNLIITVMKDLIRSTDDLLLLSGFESLFDAINNNNEMQIIEMICSNGFIDWIFSKLENLLEQLELHKCLEILTTLEFFVNGTDKSPYFCRKITNNKKVLEIIKLIIRTKTDFESFNIALTSTINIINNITYQIDEPYFKDSDITTFLIQQVSGTEKVQCVITLMRLLSENEIQQFGDVVCSIIPQLIENLKICCESRDLIYDGFGLTEILKNLRVICKSNQGKFKLQNDDNVIFHLKIILLKSNLRKFRPLARNVMNLLYTSTKIEEIENEIKNDSTCDII